LNFFAKNLEFENKKVDAIKKFNVFKEIEKKNNKKKSKNMNLLPIDSDVVTSQYFYNQYLCSILANNDITRIDDFYTNYKKSVLYEKLAIYFASNFID